MTHKLDADGFFIHRVQTECAARGLNFFLIEPIWAELFHDYLASEKVWARVLLNMHSEHHDPGDLYHRIIRLAHHRKVRVIDPPDTALAAFDKARLHARLVEAGLEVPATVIVPRSDVAGFQLTDAHRELLGSPFIIKPSLGYGRKGLVADATYAADIQRSQNAFSDPHSLLQRKIKARVVGEEPAYFRVFNVFGSLWHCWWNFHTDRYREVSQAEFAELGLAPLEAISAKLAALTGMKFFSSEVALTEEGRFVVIDYVNDQCHLLSQGADPVRGVPDVVVAGVARRLVEGATMLIKGGG